MEVIILGIGAWFGINALLLAGLWIFTSREDRRRGILKQLED